MSRCGFIVVSAVLACAGPAAAQSSGAALSGWLAEAADYHDDPAQVARGEPLYAEHCASCHGAELEGAPNWREANDDGTLPAPPHDASGHTWHHADRLLFAYTKLGGAEALAAEGVKGFNSAMPGFGDVLSDEDINAILAFIKSTWPHELREAQARMNAADARSDTAFDDAEQARD